jgi:hypothetical protein
MIWIRFSISWIRFKKPLDEQRIGSLREAWKKVWGKDVDTAIWLFTRCCGATGQACLGPGDLRVRINKRQILIRPISQLCFHPLFNLPITSQ